MAASAVAHPNGAFQPTVDLVPELVQYDKILHLRDDVLAGRHPRLKIDSQKKPSKVATPPGLNGSVPSLSSSSLTNGNSSRLLTQINNTGTTAHNPTAALATSTNTNVNSSKSQHPIPPTIPPSGFDPIFLTKSEDLISAEMKLGRERLERNLEQQHQQKKANINKKGSDQDAIPDFDVGEVLEKALETVKPLTLADIVAANEKSSAGSDSIDDDTFYSSRVGDSEEDERLRPHVKATKPCKYFFEGKCNRSTACNFSHDPAFNKKLSNEQVNADAAIPDAYGDNQRRDSPPRGPRRGSPDYGREEGELIEESSYSPPRAPDLYDGRAARRNRNGGDRNARGGRNYDNHSPPRATAPDGRRRSGRASPVYDNPIAPQGERRTSGRASPVNDGQVVRNHITSPIAPQPARVSPLAVAKVQNLGRTHHDGLQDGPQNVQQNGQRNGPPPLPPPQNINNRKAHKHTGSNQESPNVGQPAKSKKRRREQEKNGNGRNVAPRRFIDSPQPRIKEEPASPPRIYTGPAPTYLPRDHRVSPVPIVHTSPHGERVVYRERVYIDEPPPRISSPSVRRVVSGPSGRYEAEPDLRRVVSARNLNRGVSPQQEHAYYSPPTIANAPRPSSRAYHAIEQSPEPHQLDYSPLQREPVMVPPARRIVVDQYGREYYERPVAPERVGSVAPRPRYIDEPEPEIVRRPSVRPEAQYQPQGRYAQPMSPEPTSPRYAESTIRYEQAPRFVEYQQAPPPRVASRAPSRAISHAPGRVELHQGDFPRQTQQQQRIIEIPRQKPVYIDDGPPSAGMPPPPVQREVMRHSVAPTGYQRTGPYPDEYEREPREVRYQPTERTRVATIQPEGARYVHEAPRYVQPDGGRYVMSGGSGYERVPREDTIVREGRGGPGDGRSGSVFVEIGPGGAPRERERRVEYVQGPPRYQ